MKRLSYKFLGLAAVLCSTTLAQAQLVDITRPTDPVALVNGTNDGDGNSGPPPGAEGEVHVIDDVGQKYLNFLDLDSGFAVTPSANPGKLPLVGLRLYSANDAVERDPASYMLSGSNDSINGPWTLISEGPLALPADRTPGGTSVQILPDGTHPANAYFQEVMLSNNALSFDHYKLTFPTLKNAAAANSMQIAEVEFLVPEPASCGMALVGLCGLSLLRRRR